MKVTLKLLSTYRELFKAEIKGNECVVEVEDGDTFELVLSNFHVPINPASVILINGQTPEPCQELSDGDVVCAFPAIAGG